ncbi:exodeoxyribonuclease VII large subunit [Aquibacillus salsiterrae]|uniref:Exodeoxyribonuclease 7 large subunit n=1 Tax=Aquibacillus salsiterrae TaxID=2950439 RepID=A0A9X4ADJ9_9BACI|nr:exodeoxyribonuclease VII large subunit [Aquibacillus salsiterrae]MDC3415481.1 exodeoxyribonuclease VII large subunit [Aquibacillus salsiterrae]
MEQNYLTVTALTRYMKRKFELDKNLNDVWIKGEISNFNQHSRGHMYFTIKDDYSRIQAVMFAGNNRFLKFKPENGMRALIRGDISVYEPQGQYQLYIKQMEPDGVGSLFLAYEQLKEQLSKEGLFDSSRKKTIPRFPNHIGVVTSPTGAAVRDILITIKRRYPLLKVTILPVLVQGSNAPSSIVKAIQFANQLNLFDVLIVGRGGGSIEELWSFNEEIVARAIATSTIPIISAVGHETDFTISDLVADVRAATPTGAAELAVPSSEELMNHVGALYKSLNRALSEKMKQSSERLTKLNKSYAFRYPEQLIVQKEQQLDRNLDRLTRSLRTISMSKHERVNHLSKRLMQKHPSKLLNQYKVDLANLVNKNQQMFNMIYHKQETTFERLVDKLTLLNPLNTMKRGYSISFTKDGKVIQSTKRVQLGEQITVKLVDGSLDCQVLGMEEEKKNGENGSNV